MYTVLLLSVALILVFVSKPSDRQSYHKAILAIFGMTYFIIWRFIAFYVDVFLLGESFKNIAFISLIVASVIISVLPWVTQIKQKPATALSFLFLISAFFSFAFEKDIKNHIAQWTGYFNQTAPVLNTILPTTDSKSFYLDAEGFSISIPETWKKKSNNSGLIYFEAQVENKKHIELRPSCFHNAETSMPEIITNILNHDKSNKLITDIQCFRQTEKLYACFIRSNGKFDNGAMEKWRWIVMDKNQRQNIELDIIFYSNDTGMRRTAEAVIHSIKYKHLPDPLPTCKSTIDWL